MGYCYYINNHLLSKFYAVIDGYVLNCYRSCQQLKSSSSSILEVKDDSTIVKPHVMFIGGLSMKKGIFCGGR